MYMQQESSTAMEKSLQDGSVMESSTKETSNIFTIYTKSGCPYCDKAKDLFREWKHIDSELHWVENNCDIYLKDPYDKEHFLDDMRKHIGKTWRTFPMIFHRDRFVGGYTDLVEYSKPFMQSVKLFSPIMTTAVTNTSAAVTVETGGEVEKRGLEKRGLEKRGLEKGGGGEGGEGRAINAQAFFDSKWEEDMTF